MDSVRVRINEPRHEVVVKITEEENISSGVISPPTEIEVTLDIHGTHICKETTVTLEQLNTARITDILEMSCAEYESLEYPVPSILYLLTS